MSRHFSRHLKPEILRNSPITTAIPRVLPLCTPSRGHVAPPKEPVVLPPPRLSLLAPRDLGFIPLAMFIDVVSGLAVQPPLSTVLSAGLIGAIFSAYKIRERSRERLETAIAGLATARLVHELSENPGLNEIMKLDSGTAPKLVPNADGLFPLVNQSPFAKTETVNGVFQIEGKRFTLEDGLFLVVASAVGKSAEGGKHCLQLSDFAVLRVRDDRWADLSYGDIRSSWNSDECRRSFRQVGREARGFGRSWGRPLHRALVIVHDIIRSEEQHFCQLSLSHYIQKVISADFRMPDCSVPCSDMTSHSQRSSCHQRKPKNHACISCY